MIFMAPPKSRTKEYGKASACHLLLISALLFPENTSLMKTKTKNKAIPASPPVPVMSPGPISFASVRPMAPFCSAEVIIIITLFPLRASPPALCTPSHPPPNLSASHFPFFLGSALFSLPLFIFVSCPVFFQGTSCDPCSPTSPCSVPSFGSFFNERWKRGERQREEEGLKRERRAKTENKNPISIQ